MNIFGKNKTPSQAPPVPPKRPEKQQPVVHRNDGAEEEEEEDQYTYEIPPSKGQGKKLASAKQQEAADNVYLDRPALRRFSEPHNLLQPRPQMFLSNSGADGGTGEETFNFQAIERALKKGMMKSPLGPPLPTSARRVSLPVLPASGPQTNAAPNRDPFLSLKDDKEESQEESIYVECEPSTVSPPCRALPTPPARPLKKPRPKISPPGAQQVLTENSPDGSCPKRGSLPEDCGMQNKAWYAGRCDRHTAEAALLQYNKDSAYLVRRSSRHGWNQPFTLAVLYKSHVYNIPIRYVESSHQYTLGKDGKSHEELFDSVASIIQNYTEHPLVLIDGSTSAKEQTCLVFPVKP